MHCESCGSENPEINRFCGHCGHSLSKPQPHETRAESSGPVLNSFREDVERQQSGLQQLREGDTEASAEPANSTPLAQLATAPSDFGPSSSLRADTDEPAGTVARREQAQQWFSPPLQAKRGRAQITGPSFLGLSDSNEQSSNLAYLYEDDAPAGHGRRWIAIMIAIAFVGFMVYEWRSNPNLNANVRGWISQIRNWRVGQTATPAPTPISASNTPPVQPAQQEPVATPPVASSSASPQPNTPATSTNSGNNNEQSNTSENPANDNPKDSGAEQDNVANSPPDHGSAAKGSEMSNPPTPPLPRKQQTPGSALVAKADNYLYGRGVPKNCDQALVYLRSAADKGNAQARSKLGGLYATGNCVPLDRVRAYNWFSLARNSGDHNVWLERNMSMLWSAMTPQEQVRVSQR